MVAGGNVTYTCQRCGRKFIGWASAERVYCGRECAAAERGKAISTHGGSYERLHGIWCHMKTRCLCKTSDAYQYYGGRGIQVCQQWIDSYEAFRDWAMANGYRDDLEIDRRDTNGNYEPGNCRWATRHQQMQNTRKRSDAKTSKFKGVSKRPLRGGWIVQLGHNGKVIRVGEYKTEIEAALAYDDAARELRGEFARLNFPERQVSHVEAQPQSRF